MQKKETSSRMKSHLDMYRKVVKHLNDEQKALLCRKFIGKIIIDWDEQTGHSVEIFYNLPIPNAVEYRSDHIENMLESFTNENEASFTFSHIVNQNAMM